MNKASRENRRKNWRQFWKESKKEFWKRFFKVLIIETIVSIIVFLFSDYKIFIGEPIEWMTFWTVIIAFGVACVLIPISLFPGLAEEYQKKQEKKKTK